MLQKILGIISDVINVVEKQQETIDNLEKKIDDLEKENMLLNTRICALEGRTCDRSCRRIWYIPPVTCEPQRKPWVTYTSTMSVSAEDAKRYTDM